MMFLYSDSTPRGDFEGNVWNMNANNAYLRHYDNLMYLRFMMKEGNFAEKYQAQKEVAICERKLKFWERHPNFEADVVTPQVEKKVKEWKGRV